MFSTVVVIACFLCEGECRSLVSMTQRNGKKKLAFGTHVFERVCEHHTPQDLKNTWKNICKAHSNQNERLHLK